MQNNQINLKSVSKIIWHNILFILASIIIFGIAGGLYAKHKKSTVYDAERSFMTERSYRGAGANEEVQADINLGKTYAEIVESKDVAKSAHRQLPSRLQKKYSVKDINGMVDAHSVMQTTIIKVNVKAKSAKNAATIVNAITDASVKQISNKVPSAGQITPFAKVSASDTHSITTPSIKKYGLLGSAVGLLVGMIIAFSVTTWKKLI